MNIWDLAIARDLVQHGILCSTGSCTVWDLAIAQDLVLRGILYTMGSHTAQDLVQCGILYSTGSGSAQDLVQCGILYCTVSCTALDLVQHRISYKGLLIRTQFSKLHWQTIVILSNNCSFQIQGQAEDIIVFIPRRLWQQAMIEGIENHHVAGPQRHGYSLLCENKIVTNFSIHAVSVNVVLFAPLGGNGCQGIEKSSSRCEFNYY